MGHTLNIEMGGDPPAYDVVGPESIKNFGFDIGQQLRAAFGPHSSELGLVLPQGLDQFFLRNTVLGGNVGKNFRTKG